MQENTPSKRPLLNRYLAYLLVSRWFVITVTFLIFLILALGLRFLSFSNDYRVFFDKDDPNLLAFEAIHNIYTDDDPVVFVITPKDGEVFSRETLASIEWLTSEARKIPYIQRVDSIQNFQYSRSKHGDLVVSDLYRNAPSLKNDQLERIGAIALSEPMLLNRLLNPSATVTGVVANFHLPGVDRQQEVPEIMQQAEKLKDELMRTNANLEIRLAGTVVSSNAFTEASSRDVTILGPIMFCLIAIALRLLLRSTLTAIAALLVISFTIVGTMGLAGWLGFVLSPASIAAPNILLTVAVADSVHVLVDFLNAVGQIRVEHRDPIKRTRFLAIIEAIQETLKPIFLTTLTTAIGFLTLNFSDSPPFRDLGNIVAIGVFLAFVLSVFFLPALLAALPIRSKSSDEAIIDSTWTATFSHYVVERRRLLAGVLGVIVLGLGSLIPQNELNDDLIKYFAEDTKFREEWEYTTANLTGLYTMEYSLRALEPGGINHPEYLRTVEKFADWFKQQPETIHVDSIVDIYKRLNKNMHGDDPSWYRLPNSQELAAQYLLLYEMSLPPGLELNGRINIDKSSSRFVASLKDLSSNEMLVLEQRAHAWLENNAPPSMMSKAGSTPLMFSHIGQSNIHGMIEGSILEFIIIAVILMLVLRSFGLGLLSLLPNVVPAAMAFGFWALVNGQINLGLSVVANMTLGIVVDDTVHFLSNYTFARRIRGFDREEAIHYTFRHVGKAMAMSTLVLVVGFAVLMLSDYQLNAQMGLLTVITIAFALLGDLFLLPSLLLVGESTRVRGYHSRKEVQAAQLQLTAVFRNVSGGYIAYLEGLPGANTQGDTLDRSRTYLEEAVALVLEVNRELADADQQASEVIRERFSLIV